MCGSSFPRELNDICPHYPTIIHPRILQECKEVYTMTWTFVFVGIKDISIQDNMNIF